MKTRYKDIHFVLINPDPAVYVCRDNKTGQELASVFYSGRQKCWVLAARENFNKPRLRDVIDFLEQF